MEEDPIVEELHAIRETMLNEHGGLEGLVKHLQALQAEMPGVTTLPSKTPVETKKKVS